MWSRTSKCVAGVTLAMVMVSLAAPWAQALPPDPDNAALLYYQGFLTMAELDDDARALIRDVAKGEVDPNDKAREYIQSCQGAIGFAEAAADVPNCHWGFRFSRGFDALMPQLAPARWLTFALVADARVRAVDGDYRGALERCLMTGTFSRHIGDDTLISYLVSIAVRALGYRCMEDLVGQTDDVELLTWLKSELAMSLEQMPSPVRPLTYEKEIVADLLRMENVEKMAQILSEADAETRQKILTAANEKVLAQARQLYVERVTAALSILTKAMPYPQAFAQLEELGKVSDPNDPASMGVAVFMPATSRIYNLTTRAETHAHAIEAAIDVCLVKAKSGELPDDLPVGAPLDAFSGQPFEYKRTDGGFTLRCRAPELGTERWHEYTFPVK